MNLDKFTRTHVLGAGSCCSRKTVCTRAFWPLEITNWLHSWGVSTCWFDLLNSCHGILNFTIFINVSKVFLYVSNFSIVLQSYAPRSSNFATSATSTSSILLIMMMWMYTLATVKVWYRQYHFRKLSTYINRKCRFQYTRK